MFKVETGLKSDIQREAVLLFCSKAKSDSVENHCDLV